MVSLDVVKSKKKTFSKKNKTKRNRQKGKPNVNRGKGAGIELIKKRFKTENIIPGPGKNVAKKPSLKTPNGVNKQKSLKNKLSKDFEIKYILNDKGNEKDFNSNCGM